MRQKKSTEKESKVRRNEMQWNAWNEMKVNVKKGDKVDGIFTSYLGRNFVLLSLSIHITSLLDNVKKL